MRTMTCVNRLLAGLLCTTFLIGGCDDAESARRAVSIDQPRSPVRDTEHEWPPKTTAIPSTFKVRHIESHWSSGIQEARRLVIKDQSAFEAIWNEHAAIYRPQPALPEIDFDSEMVLAVFMGSRPSSGYSISIDTIEELPDAIRATVHSNSPPPHLGTAAVVTHPYHIVAIDRTDKPIVFDEAPSPQ